METDTKRIEKNIEKINSRISDLFDPESNDGNKLVRLIDKSLDEKLWPGYLLHRLLPRDIKSFGFYGIFLIFVTAAVLSVIEFGWNEPETRAALFKKGVTFDTEAKTKRFFQTLPTTFDDIYTTSDDEGLATREFFNWLGKMFENGAQKNPEGFQSLIVDTTNDLPSEIQTAFVESWGAMLTSAEQNKHDLRKFRQGIVNSGVFNDIVAIGKVIEAKFPESAKSRAEELAESGQQQERSRTEKSERQVKFQEDRWVQTFPFIATNESTLIIHCELVTLTTNDDQEITVRLDSEKDVLTLKTDKNKPRAPGKSKGKEFAPGELPQNESFIRSLEIERETGMASSVICAVTSIGPLNCRVDNNSGVGICKN